MLVRPSVLDHLSACVARAPDKRAFAFLGPDGTEVESHSYESFLARVQAFSEALAARPEIETGDRVLLVFPPGLDMVAALFGCAHAGVIAVPVAPVTAVDVTAAVARIAAVAQDCGARVVLGGRDPQQLLSARAAEARDAPDACARIAALTWLVAEDIPMRARHVPLHRPQKLFMLQYTSGSTSAPKGVMVTHDNILANRALLVDHDDPVCVTWLPQHHDLGLIGCYTYSVLSGGTCIGFAPATFIQRPALWLQVMARHRATAASAPNFAFDFCLDPRRVPDRVLDGLDLSSLHHLSVSAEPVRPETYRRFLARFERTGLSAQQFVTGYGMAEYTLVATHYGRGALSVDRRALAEGRVRPVDRSFQIGGATRVMSCGVPVGDTELRIVDPDSGRALPEDAVGEIWLRGRSCAAGYWNRPRLSRQSFDVRLGEGEGGHLRTGDLGFLHEGALYVCGRSKEMMILRGQNFFPQDIEAAAEEAMPGRVTGITAAVSLPDADADPSVVLVVEQRRAEPPCAATVLAAAVRDRVGLDLDRVVFVPRQGIPRTTSGKTRRVALAESLAAGAVPVLADHALRPAADRSAAAQKAPAESLLDELRNRCARSPDKEMTLQDAGLDSLDLVVVFHALREWFSDMGWGALAEGLDIGTLQSLRLHEMFEALAAHEAGAGPDAASIARTVAALREARLRQDQQQMQADLTLAASLPPLRPASGADRRDGRLLLTGATGFFGPFLLQQALEQTDGPVVALVRAPDGARAAARLADHLRSVGLGDLQGQIGRRVSVVAGDLGLPCFGLDASEWARLAEEVDTVFHNGAVVNYLQTYRQMRAANVIGTRTALQLAHTARPKVFNHVSTTFVFGWRMLDKVREDDHNDAMQGLDFGYSQSKWVAEGLVRQAARRGLPTRVFRPSLITPTLAGQGSGMDITLRLIAFMVKHGIGVASRNEISLLPAEVAARNMMAIAGGGHGLGQTFHVTRDDHACMADIMASLARLTGRSFKLCSVQDFVPEVIARCTREDPLYPLVDFLMQAVGWMAEMEHKRYDSAGYRAARDASAAAVPDPSLDAVLDGVLRYLDSVGLT